MCDVRDVVSLLVTAPNDQSPGSSTEANLDIHYVIGMANGVQVTKFMTSGPV